MCWDRKRVRRLFTLAAYTLVGKKYECYSAVNIINECLKYQIDVLEGKGGPHRIDWDV